MLVVIRSSPTPITRFAAKSHTRLKGEGPRIGKPAALHFVGCKPDFVPSPLARNGRRPFLCSLRSPRRSGVRLIPGVSRGTGKPAWPRNRTGRPFPCSVLHRMGFVVPPRLLSGRWALTPPFHPCPSTSSGRFVFCDTFRRRRISPPTPSLAGGMPPSGVRTFLPRGIPPAGDRPPTGGT